MTRFSVWSQRQSSSYAVEGLPKGCPIYFAIGFQNQTLEICGTL